MCPDISSEGRSRKGRGVTGWCDSVTLVAESKVTVSFESGGLNFPLYLLTKQCPLPRTGLSDRHGCEVHSGQTEGGDKARVNDTEASTENSRIFEDFKLLL